MTATSPIFARNALTWGHKLPASTHFFEAPLLGLASSAHLALVTSVKDPGNLNRVQLRILSCDGASDQDAEIWARVAVPFAGDKRGAFFIPSVGDEVIVVFVSNDSRFPVVVGSLWNGSAHAPDQFGGSGDAVDRWLFVGKAGTRIAIVEESGGEPKIEFKTPGGVTGTLTDDGGGKVEFKDTAGSSIKIDSSGITLQTSSKVQVQASQVQVSAGQVTVDAAMSTFSGMVKCDVMQATTVIATTYTPGAGNIW
jgi:uncharacterized protein involved in type VI secretion and phage assembly